MNPEVYIQDGNVYAGTRLLPIKDQRGRQYVHYNGRQINIKQLPTLQPESEDCVFNYIFNGGYINHPCPAMQYWITRHRLKKRITTQQFKQQYKHTFKHFKPIP